MTTQVDWKHEYEVLSDQYCPQEAKLEFLEYQYGVIRDTLRGTGVSEGIVQLIETEARERYQAATGRVAP